MRLVCPPTQEEEALETLVRVVAAAVGADDACSLCSSLSLSLSGGNRGATFASNYFNLRPRLPLWTDRKTDRLPGTIIVKLK